MIRRFALAATALAALPLATSGPAAAQTAWTVDQEASAIAVVGRAEAGGMSMNVELAFTDYSFDIRFDRNDLANSHIEGRVATTDYSAELPGSRQEQFDETVRSDTWLDVDAHSEAVFVSNDIEAGDENDYLAHGELTIAGTTREKTLPFNLTDNSGGGVTARGKAPIDRRAYGIGEDSWDDSVAAEPTLHYRIVARPQDG